MDLLSASVVTWFAGWLLALALVVCVDRIRLSPIEPPAIPWPSPSKALVELILWALTVPFCLFWLYLIWKQRGKL